MWRADKWECPPLYLRLRKACFLKKSLLTGYTGAGHSLRDTISTSVMKTKFLHLCYTLSQNNLPENSGSPFPSPFFFKRKGYFSLILVQTMGKVKTLVFVLRKWMVLIQVRYSISFLLSKQKEDLIELSFDRWLNIFFMTVYHVIFGT